jgi:hypothetical protein
MTTILSATIAAPGTFFGLPFAPLDPKLRFIPQNANVEAVFSYGSGGTSVDVYLQVSHDGASWRDIGHFGQLTTRTLRDIWRASSADSVLDADIQNPAPHLSWWRVRYVVVGAYVGTNLQINVIGVDLVQAGVGF